MRFQLDPRCKLYLLLIGNLLLFFHVDLETELLLMLFFLFPFYLGDRWKMGLRLTVTYLVLVLLDLTLVPVAEGILATWISLLAVAVRMMYPCIVTGVYAFATTGVSEFVCALRKMRVPEMVIIPCMVVIRFFPTIREDYAQIRNAMKFRGGSPGEDERAVTSDAESRICAHSASDEQQQRIAGSLRGGADERNRHGRGAYKHHGDSVPEDGCIVYGSVHRAASFLHSCKVSR